MNITVDRLELQHALGLVKRAAVNKTAFVPVLRNVLLDANNCLRLTCSNLEHAVRLAVPAQIETPGAITLPVDKLEETAKLWDGEDINLAVEPGKQKARLRCGRYKATVLGIDAEEFPQISALDGTGYELDARALALALRRTVFAAGRDESRQMLSGVYVRSFGDGRLDLAAADGLRMSVATLTDTAIPEGSWLVPAAYLADLAAMINSDDPVAIRFDERRAGFETRRALAVIQLLDLQFPDYEQIIPQALTTRIVVETVALQQAMRQALVLARDAVFMVHLKITPATMDTPGILEFRAQSDDGDVSGEVNILEREGHPLEIGMNVSFLLAALKVAETPQISLAFNGTNNPVVIRPVGDESFLHVVMPMVMGR
jgi:DNA polymerase-3 subunit beta